MISARNNAITDRPRFAVGPGAESLRCACAAIALSAGKGNIGSPSGSESEAAMLIGRAIPQGGR